jgi:hypothetical protein
MGACVPGGDEFLVPPKFGRSKEADKQRVFERQKITAPEKIVEAA